MTDTTNGWTGKPGVPLNPEKDGWHIVQEGDLEPEYAFWRAYNFLEHDLGWWETKGGEDFIQPHETSNWRYFGPALSHDDATALQARVAELEGALRPFAELGRFVVEHHPDPETDLNHEISTLVRHFRNAHVALEGKKA